MVGHSYNVDVYILAMCFLYGYIATILTALLHFVIRIFYSLVSVR